MTLFTNMISYVQNQLFKVFDNEKNEIVSHFVNIFVNVLKNLKKNLDWNLNEIYNFQTFRRIIKKCSL